MENDKSLGQTGFQNSKLVIKDGSTVRYASIFAKRYGTLVRYAFFVMVRVRYVGTVRLFVMVRVRYVSTLFELKIPDFSYIAPDFCMQRQKTAKSDAKCVNWDRWFIG